MIVTLDELVSAGHGDQQYQELFAEMSVYTSYFIFLLFVSIFGEECHPTLPLDNSRVMVIVWRLRANTIRTALCWIV